ncbi:hypothetical protein TWF106_007111 [Orbilia oligospora]|uniref:F-box domain-containing protein n=1 Tax=Orbilia oligospora TaxID=2813651 RepID=A0A6G1M574_ORBOL|nr:hypothetical protein TWF679_008208 [Orbilia oligospora]KAF3219270.1 hypothetical protein TWF106_007111 [Orbilia oligospora]KAF3220508.1 hypothetical protein TWF191_007407 [Orbilia oligospora]KAF3244079.1 hypothetical protein TWF192_007885 [Orbilia oligospora]
MRLTVEESGDGTMRLPMELQLQILEAADFIQLPTLIQVCTAWQNHIHAHIHSHRFMARRYAVHPRAVDAEYPTQFGYETADAGTLPPLPGYHLGILYPTHLLLAKGEYHPCHIEFYEEEEKTLGRQPKISSSSWRIFKDDQCVHPAIPGNSESSLETRIIGPSSPPSPQPSFSTNFLVMLESKIGVPVYGYRSVGKLFRSIAYFHRTVFISRRQDEGRELDELIRVKVDCRVYPGSGMTMIYIWFEEEERKVEDAREVIRLIL